MTDEEIQKLIQAYLVVLATNPSEADKVIEHLGRNDLRYVMSVIGKMYLIRIRNL